MPEWQRKRADCNNGARWGGRRVHVEPNRGYETTRGRSITFTRGLTIGGIGYQTANTWGTSSSVGYEWKHKYNWYWICGDGGRRNAAGEPDPRTWINLFAGGDPALGRAG